MRRSIAVLRIGAPEPVAGWIGVGAIAAIYAALYVLNIWLPLNGVNHTTRIWDWSQLALTATAGLVVIVMHRRLTSGAVAVGLLLAVVSALAHFQRDPSVEWSIIEGGGVWLCFVAGAVLLAGGAQAGVRAFQPPLAAIGRSLAVGALIALPLAAVNNLYFFLNSGAVPMRSAMSSALAALSPAIHEEVIFRFFVLALCLSLLRDSPSRRLVVVSAVFLAVVPHSLNHLPDLFTENLAMGVFMLAATSLLFGLPLAALQLKRNLESAIAFHWCIDFLRFLFGY